MIEITPLDIRKKRGDFGRTLRGYDPEEVDTFLELVAERLEEVVKELSSLREEAAGLRDRVSEVEGRERAVQEALVMAQELREEIRSHAHREADLIRREAEEEVERIRARTGTLLEERREALSEADRNRAKALRDFRAFLERELEAVKVEESRPLPAWDDPAPESADGAVEVGGEKVEPQGDPGLPEQEGLPFGEQDRAGVSEARPPGGESPGSEEARP